MRGWVLTFGCLVVWLNIAVQARADRASGISIDLVPTHKAFLSTEPITGLLRIVNHSGSSVAVGLRSYVVTHSTGKLIDTDDSRIAPRIVPTIANGSTYEKEIVLPRCVSIQTQCSFDLQVNQMLYAANEPQFSLRTPIRHIVIRADPTATFDIQGLTGNRPVLIVQANAKGEKAPDLLGIGFAPRDRAMSRSDLVQLLNEMVAALKQNGIDSRGWEVAQDSGFPVLRLYVDPSTPHDRLDPVLAKMTNQFSTRATPVQSIYAISIKSNDEGVYRTWGTRLDSALRRISIVAKFDDPNMANYYDRPTVRSEWDNSPVQYNDFFFTVNSSSLSPIPIRYQATRAYISSTPLRFVPPTVAGKEFFADWTRALGTYEKPLVISNDRLHILAIGTSKDEWAWQDGREPDAVALDNAKRRIAVAAKILGVSTGYESLIVRYLSDMAFENSRGVHAIGLAVTASDEAHASWRRARVNRSWGTPHASPFRPAPIAAYDEQSTIRGEAESPVILPADGTRLEIGIEIRGEQAGAVDAHKLAERFRHAPHVRDLAVQSSGFGGKVFFEFLFDTTARSAINGVRDRIVAAYPVPASDVLTRVSAIRHDCTVIDTDALRTAFAMATNDALLAAAAGSVRLQHLVLAEAYPLITQGRECETHARIVPWYDSAGADPLYLHATMHAALTFRTSAPVH